MSVISLYIKRRSPKMDVLNAAFLLCARANAQEHQLTVIGETGRNIAKSGKHCFLFWKVNFTRKDICLFL
jgi:uncharacterized Ntn-hydrolase superfamily protein